MTMAGALGALFPLDARPQSLFFTRVLRSSRKREADAGGILLRGKDDAKLVKREDGSFAIEKK